MVTSVLLAGGQPLHSSMHQELMNHHKEHSTCYNTCEMQTMLPDSNHTLSNLEVTELAVRHCHVMKGQQLNWFHNHMFHQRTAATLKR